MALRASVLLMMISTVSFGDSFPSIEKFRSRRVDTDRLIVIGEAVGRADVDELKQLFYEMVSTREGLRVLAKAAIFIPQYRVDGEDGALYRKLVQLAAGTVGEGPALTKDDVVFDRNKVSVSALDMVRIFALRSLGSGEEVRDIRFQVLAEVDVHPELRLLAYEGLKDDNEGLLECFFNATRGPFYGIERVLKDLPDLDEASMTLRVHLMRYMLELIYGVHTQLLTSEDPGLQEVRLQALGWLLRYFGLQSTHMNGSDSLLFRGRAVLTYQLLGVDIPPSVLAYVAGEPIKDFGQRVIPNPRLSVAESDYNRFLLFARIDLARMYPAFAREAFDHDELNFFSPIDRVIGSGLLRQLPPGREFRCEAEFSS